MKTIKFESREQWALARSGKITGTGLKDIAPSGGPGKEEVIKELETLKIEFKKTAKKEELQALLPKESIARLMCSMDKKLGFYELIAERLAVTEENFDGYVPNETPMDRGTRLQSQAIARVSEKLDKKVDDSLVMWVRDENESIAISPDGVISDTEAVETKCLSSAKHLQAYLENKIPDEYEFQKLQYFIVNDKLEKLHFGFYDPRIPVKDFFVITFDRKDVQKEIDVYLELQRLQLAEVDRIVGELSGF